MKPKNTAPRLNTKNSVFGEGKELHASSPLSRVGMGGGGWGEEKVARTVVVGRWVERG